MKILLLTRIYNQINKIYILNLKEKWIYRFYIVLKFILIQEIFVKTLAIVNNQCLMLAYFEMPKYIKRFWYFIFFKLLKLFKMAYY